MSTIGALLIVLIIVAVAIRWFAQALSAVFRAIDWLVGKVFHREVEQGAGSALWIGFGVMYLELIVAGTVLKLMHIEFAWYLALVMFLMTMAFYMYSFNRAPYEVKPSISAVLWGAVICGVLYVFRSNEWVGMLWP